LLSALALRIGGDQLFDRRLFFLQLEFIIKAVATFGGLAVRLGGVAYCQSAGGASGRDGDSEASR